MIDLHFVSQFMYEHHERVTVSSDGTHFHARCVLCGDSKKSLSKKRFHLDWSPARVVWQCWNCGRSGNFLQLYSRIKGISTTKAYKILYKFEHEGYKESLKKRNGDTPPKKTRENISHNDILDDCVSYDPDSLTSMMVHEMLFRFRAARNIPEQYKLYYANKGKFRNRIIIPIFDENQDIIYFQARRRPGSDTQPKYLNPSTEKSLIIHNEHIFDKDKYIIVTEGLLDAFSVGNQSTPCLGKEITEEFIKILFEKTDTGIVIAYDNDEDGMRSLRKFMFGDYHKKPHKYYKQVKYFLMPQRFLQYKDINKLCSEEKISVVYDFICKNSYDYMKTALKLQLEER